MKVKVLGCHGGTAPGYRTSCYFINDKFLIDCGSAASALSPQQQSEITNILITHPHIDHIKDICFVIENTFRPERKPLVLRSTKAILEDVHTHLFNDVLWPDFSKIYVDAQRSKSLMRFETLHQGYEIDGLKISYETVNHPVNAVGYILDDGKQQIVFTGDTGPTHAIWNAANQCKNLVAIFTEISFPTRMDGLARAAGHFTTKQLLEEIDKINNKTVPIFIAHFKPLFFEELMDEFHRSVPDRMKLLHQEDEFIFA